LVNSSQTDKDGNLVYLYATDKDSQYTYIETAKNKGYDVLLMDGELDVPFIQQVEAKSEKTRFVRVDSDVIENLIPKADKASVSLSEDEQKALKDLFSKQLPEMDKMRFDVQIEALGEDSLPIVLTQNEFMRRMQEMAKLQPGMSFYGEMPASFAMVLNADHRLVKELVGVQSEESEDKVKQLIDLSLLSNGLLKGEALNKHRGRVGYPLRAWFMLVDVFLYFLKTEVSFGAEQIQVVVGVHVHLFSPFDAVALLASNVYGLDSIEILRKTGPLV
jgi:molecular chaperone HtpG